MRRINVDERRARLGLHHRLAKEARTGTVAEIAADLVGLHSSDPATVYLSIRARSRPLSVPEIEHALYEERSVIRVLGMRRTLFVVPLDLAPLVVAGCAEPMAPAETRRLAKMLSESGITNEPGPWLKQVIDETLAAIRVRGQAPATELSKAVPALANQMSFGEGRKWAGKVGVSTRVLFLLATDARIVRTRPRGSWISGQYRWSATEDWLGQSLPRIDLDEARAELARRWLRAYGPGTITDLKWWTGWPVTAVRKAVEKIGAIQVQLSEALGYVLPNDDEPIAEPEPWAAFLPGLDSTVMGWKERSWYLGDHGPRLFDTSGNAGPTVWWQGRVVGGWGQRATGEIVYQFLEDVGEDGRTQIETEAAALQDWMGKTTVTPRFRTPLEIEIGS
ncbi:MAG TPA: winged helix DNA-binding domain-containing protein [Acidimicrobiia bacterium]|nr:winged helix DNA-binding domain-containing protein [Acidimicrobiia bacterium]